MLCDACRAQDASVHVTKVVEGEVALEHLCAACAAARGMEVEAAAPSAPKHVLGQFLHSAQEQVAAERNDAACSFCHLTLKEFRASGRLGCARCYATFEPSLRPLLRRVHGSAQHTGRRYMPPAPEILHRATTIGELRDRLRRAILNEEFELAATLRDQLKGAE